MDAKEEAGLSPEDRQKINQAIDTAQDALKNMQSFEYEMAHAKYIASVELLMEILPRVHSEGKKNELKATVGKLLDKAEVCKENMMNVGLVNSKDGYDKFHRKPDQREVKKYVNQTIDEMNNPKRPIARGATGGGAGGAHGGANNAGGAQNANKLSLADKEQQQLLATIENEIIDKGSSVRWDDIAGLELAKKSLHEAIILPNLRPDLFTGIRAPPKGLLLFGPPGNGKTLLAKAVASECGATFFNMSASTLTSKYMGEGEKLVKVLFAIARERQPAVIFIDEIDSILSARSSSEHEASRRLKTEFLVQFDGAATLSEERVLVMGATNRPQELDDAVIRRLPKKIYIPLPEPVTREIMIKNSLKGVEIKFSKKEWGTLIEKTDGYSGSDLNQLCKEAAYGPIREIQSGDLAKFDSKKLRPVKYCDFKAAMARIRPSVNPSSLRTYIDWDRENGAH
eukprot:CAMPEP_0115025146 /NCGR_PEP_ID=MMETSP0216-20121206/33785_1 /TAXON_ID=223996 /ORGANISM="Protocruzia adherens, Strain Boccale" /LENGTH=454 /DNA_ID=CAMNT_0002399591 /DNA_START=136 /DNA_END=1500 /DNA_ORIENTATION=+